MYDQTKRLFSTCGAAALSSLFLVAPLAWLELRNNPALARSFWEFPLPLFVMLWFLPTVFIIIAAPLVRTVRAGQSLLAAPVKLLLSTAFLALLAMMWGSLLADQLPCFLGYPNCD